MKRINSGARRELRRNLCDAYGGLCAYCCRPVGMAGTVDHYVPEALGGSNAWKNLRWSCRACNETKADMPPDEWERVQPVLRPKVETKASVRVQLLQLIAQRHIEASRANSQGPTASIEAASNSSGD